MNGAGIWEKADRCSLDAGISQENRMTCVGCAASPALCCDPRTTGQALVDRYGHRIGDKQVSEVDATKYAHRAVQLLGAVVELVDVVWLEHGPQDKGLLTRQNQRQTASPTT